MYPCVWDPFWVLVETPGARVSFARVPLGSGYQGPGGWLGLERSGGYVRGLLVCWSCRACAVVSAMSFGGAFAGRSGNPGSGCGSEFTCVSSGVSLGRCRALVAAPPELRGWAPDALEAYVRMHAAACRLELELEDKKLEQKRLEVRLRELDLEVMDRQVAVAASAGCADSSAGSASQCVPAASSGGRGAGGWAGGLRAGGFSRAAGVRAWQGKVMGRAGSVGSWRSGPASSASGFSTEGGAVPAAESVCNRGRCYTALAAEGCRSALVRRCGRWPKVSRLLALPASEFSMARLAGCVLVRSDGDKWHVSDADEHPPATATVSDVLARLVREHDDVLEVGDPRWRGTLLEALGRLPEPLGTFDLPDLSSRVGGPGSEEGRVGVGGSSGSKFCELRVSLGSVRGDPEVLRRRVEELERVFSSDGFPRVYDQLDMLEGGDWGHFRASGKAGWRDGNRLVKFLKLCGYVVSESSGSLVAECPGSLPLSAPLGAGQELETLGAVGSGFCYLAAVRARYRGSMASLLGPFPSFEALLRAPMVAFYSPRLLSGLAVGHVEGRLYHLEQSVGGSCSLDSVLKALAFGRYDEAPPGTLMAEYARDASVVSYSLLGFPGVGDVLGATGEVGSPGVYTSFDPGARACPSCGCEESGVGESVCGEGSAGGGVGLCVALVLVCLVLWLVYVISALAFV